MAYEVTHADRVIRLAARIVASFGVAEQNSAIARLAEDEGLAHDDALLAAKYGGMVQALTKALYLLRAIDQAFALPLGIGADERGQALDAVPVFLANAEAGAALVIEETANALQLYGLPDRSNEISAFLHNTLPKAVADDVLKDWMKANEEADAGHSESE